MDKYSAADTDERADGDIKRPVDSGKDARDADQRSESEIPPAHFAVEIKNDHRQREKPGGVPRRQGISGFADERSKA